MKWQNRMKYSDIMLIVLWKNLVLCLMKSFQNTKPLTQVFFFYFVLSFRLAILLNKNKIRHLEWIKYQTINKAEAKISVLLIKKLPFFRHRGFFSVNFVYLQNSQQFLWIVTHSTHIHWGFSFLFGPCIFCPFLGVKFIQLRIFPFWIKKKSCWKIQSVV